MPTPADATTFQIASLNESLYLEGMKSVNNGSDQEKLIGTVLVGDLPVPVIFNDTDAQKSIIPYVDFEDKYYHYNHVSKRYSENDTNIDGLNVEIWHGIVAPNSGSQEGNIDAINKYFDKNNDYYTGQGLFDDSKGVMNGLVGSDISDNHTPYVFYFDQFREEQSLSYDSYNAYLAFVENKEDILYNRYNTELAEKIQEKVLGSQEESLDELKSLLGEDFEMNSPELTNIPDIQTRHIINKVTKKFAEIFSKGSIGELRKNVHNAGRYNGANNSVNVDFIPYLVTILDSVHDEIIKEVSDEMEEEINVKVISELQKNIHLPVKLSIPDSRTSLAQDSYCSDFNVVNSDLLSAYTISNESTLSHTGTYVNSVNDVLHSISLALDDNLGGNSTAKGYVASYIVGGNYTSTSLGGLQTSINSVSNVDYELKSVVQIGNDLLKAIESENIGEITSELSSLHNYFDDYYNELCDNSSAPGRYYTNYMYGVQAADVNSVSDCTLYRGSRNNSGTFVEANRAYNISNISLDNTFLDEADGGGNKCFTTFKSNFSGLNGYYGKNSGFYLDQDKAAEGELLLKNGYNPHKSLVKVFDIAGAKEILNNYTDESSYLECLDNNFIYTRFLNRHSGGFFSRSYNTLDYQIPFDNSNDDGLRRWSCTTENQILDFDYTYEELDSIRPCTNDTECITNQGKVVNFKSIPSFLKHVSPTAEELHTQIVSGITPSLPIDRDRYIDYQDKSGNYAKINYPYLFRFNLPEGVEYTYENFDIYFKKYLDDNILNFGGVDLYSFLQSKDDKKLTVGSDEKKLSYYDSLVFALYWSNLDSTSAKYKYVFENYLHDQFQGNSGDYHLPKNKKQYEIAYLGAEGTAENMYIQMNPESKGENPYADIILYNAEVQSTLLGENISSADGSSDFSGPFGSCAPPEGVEIFKWMPAITCWMSDLLPPTISVSEGGCGSSLGLLSDEDREYLEECEGDVNKNAINDCIENKLNGGSLVLFSDGDRYYYNSPGVLTAHLVDSNNNLVTFDNQTNVKFNIVTIEEPENKDKEFTNSNKKVVFSEGDNIANIKKYINFSPSDVVVHAGVAESQFTSKGGDVNVYFQASVEIENNLGEKEIHLIGDELKVEVRGDRLFTTRYGLLKDVDTGLISTPRNNNLIVAEEESQLFLYDANKIHIDEIKDDVFVYNSITDKQVIRLENKSKSGTNLSMN
ncbi:hypothetical protein N8455_00635, partial [Candidatus Gracilibacteria bacterium]|nr:hypothetical protein [Candidatus Gracilibacteria bacterium]